MARIRTVKPEFFTSEDVVALTPFARLLFIALWCEADKEGRMAWKPLTFKMRYFPADNLDIHALCSELIERGLVIQYGDGLAYIPSFTRHQHINPRETQSTFPSPPDRSRVEHASATRQPRVDDASSTRDARVEHASGDSDERVSTRASTVSDAQGGRKEGKGREVKAATVVAMPSADDFRAEMWRRWKALDDGGGGAYLSKLMKSHPEELVLQAVERTLDHEPADPKAFVVACIRNLQKGKQADDDFFATAI